MRPSGYKRGDFRRTLDWWLGVEGVFWERTIASDFKKKGKLLEMEGWWMSTVHFQQRSCVDKSLLWEAAPYDLKADLSGWTPECLGDIVKKWGWKGFVSYAKDMVLSPRRDGETLEDYFMKGWKGKGFAFQRAHSGCCSEIRLEAAKFLKEFRQNG